MADDFIPDSGGDDFVPVPPPEPSFLKRLFGKSDTPEAKGLDSKKPNLLDRIKDFKPVPISQIKEDGLNPLMLGSPAAGASIAGLINAPGATGGSMAMEALLSKLLPEGAGPLTQGLARGAGAGTGALVGQGLQNLTQGKDFNPLPSPTDVPGMAGAAAPFLAGPLAGLFAKTGSQSLGSKGLSLTEDMASAAGLAPKELQGASAGQFTGPLQDKFYAPNPNIVYQAQDDVLKLRSQLIDTSANLRDAQKDLAAATASGDQQLTQQKQAIVDSLTQQAAQNKSAGVQAAEAYTNQRHDLERQLEGMSPNDLRRPEIEKSLKELKRETEAAQAHFGVTAATIGEGQADAKGMPIKVDEKALPLSAKVNGLQDTKNALNDQIAQQDIVAKRLTLGQKLGTTPEAVKTIPHGQEMYQDLTKAASTGNTEFNNLLLEPNHLRVAMAALPQDADTLKKGVLTALFQRSQVNGKWDAAKMQNAFNGDDGQGLASLRMVLGQNADQGAALSTKVKDFGQLLDTAQKSGSGVLKFLKHGATLDLVVGLATGRLEGPLIGAAAGAGTAVAVTTATNLAEKFFTSDQFRKQAMAWATGPAVGKDATAASRAFMAYLHANVDSANPNPAP